MSFHVLWGARCHAYKASVTIVLRMMRICAFRTRFDVASGHSRGNVTEYKLDSFMMDCVTRTPD